MPCPQRDYHRVVSVICDKVKIKKVGDDMEVLSLLILLVVSVLIGKDANSRGMNGLGWFLFTLLVCIVAIPVYLVVRKPAPGER